MLFSFLPANSIRPINSFLPMLSKSITITSKEHSLIFSHGTLKLKDSLNTGFNVHVNIGVFLFLPFYRQTVATPLRMDLQVKEY